MGITCRHILIWMRLKQVLLLPEKYILHRWTKKAKINPIYQPATNSFVGKKLWTRRVKLRLSAFEVVDMASLTEERSNYFAGVLKGAILLWITMFGMGVYDSPIHVWEFIKLEG
ncbi:unnamed protein product, partial [Cuscuta europaea]